MSIPSENKFTNKSIAYDKHRPAYPVAVMKSIFSNFKAGDIVADIGAGTGHLSLLLAKHGLHVLAIEPNDELRGCLEAKLVQPSRVQSIKGKAQQTGLQDHSVDGITMGNVAHWLDKNPETLVASLREMQRISRPNATIAIAFTYPSMRNSWIGDIFALAQKYDSSFDPSIITATLTDPSHHALSFIKAIDSEQAVSFQRQLSKSDFVEFMSSHSFCNEAMRPEIEAIFEHYATGGLINVEFDSVNYNGRLRAVHQDIAASRSAKDHFHGF